MSRPALLYLTVVGLHLLALVTAGLPVGATKLLIVPALGYAVWRTRGRAPVPPAYLLALVASWAGDYLLLLARDGLDATAQGLFVAGAAAFALAHGCYLRLALTAGGRLPPKPVLALLLLGAVSASMLLHLPWVMTLYGAVVLTLVLVTGTLPQNPPPDVTLLDVDAPAGGAYPGARAVFYGAIAFAASDALIGLGMIELQPLPTPWASVAIMGLYAAGQWGLRGLAVARR